jgi:hypothetical protein
VATLSLTKNYADSTILFASDFDAIIDDLETFLNTTKINDDNIQAAGLTASTVFADSSVSVDKLANLSVTTAKIADSTISSDNIDSLAVTAAKIVADAVTTAKFDTGAVTTAKIPNNLVTHAKILSNYVSGSSSGFVSVDSETPTTFTNLSATITVVANPVEIRVCSASNTLASGCFSWNGSASGATWPEFYIYRDGSSIARLPMKSAIEPNSAPFGAPSFALSSLGPILDVPGAGTYTYTVKAAWSSGGSGAILSSEMRIFVREL